MQAMNRQRGKKLREHHIGSLHHTKSHTSYPIRVVYARVWQPPYHHVRIANGLNLPVMGRKIAEVTPLDSSFNFKTVVSSVCVCMVFFLDVTFAAKISVIQKGFFEGDILLDKRMSEVVDGRVSVSNRLLLWPNGLVPYVIDSSLNSYQYEVRLIRQAFTVIQRESCLAFIPRTHQQQYVRFIRGNGCYSYVGRSSHIKNGQPISIGQGCAHLGIVLHEIMHSLGFFHTSSRPDRDSYVAVYYNNIQPGFEHNFRKYSRNTVSRLGSPYDFHSLMHLPGNSFKKSGAGNTIVARAGAGIVLGQLNQLSPIDIQEINILYRCSTSKGCYHALGMEDKRIADRSITASSYKYYDRPHQARLHELASSKGNGAWCAASASSGQYLIVDLGKTKKLSGIATQGKQETFFDAAWVKSYRLEYKTQQYSSWRSIYQYFTGNWDDTGVKYSTLVTPVYARYIKIRPQSWHAGICMRVELYGCDG